MAGAVLLMPAQIAAQTPQLAFSKTLYGTPGLVEMPSAERFADGELVTTFAQFDNTGRSTLSFQITPRLTGSFRYSRLDEFIQPTRETLYDRSFDLSYLILTEGKIRPAVSVGIQDFIGTGVYGGEYIVATKALTPDVRVSAGLGWGRFGGSGAIGAPFGTRPPIVLGQGGTVNSDQWFRGDVAPFGGVAWRAGDRLTFKAEYSSDAYTAEVAAGTINRRSSWNFGVDYRISPAVTLSGAWLYGSEAAVQLNFALNPKTPKSPSGREPGPLPVRTRPSPAADPEAWSTEWAQDNETIPETRQVVANVLAKDGIVVKAMSVHRSSVSISIRNTRYAAAPQAIGRTARVLSRALPASVERFTIISVTEGGMETSSVTLTRSDLERLEHAPAAAMGDRVAIGDAAILPAPDPVEGNEQSFRWSISPFTTISLFDPDNPVRADIGIRAQADYEFGPGFVLSGSVRKKVVGNLDEVSRRTPSSLPRVRSDYAFYDIQGDPAIERLTLAWYARPGANLYSRVTAGYLEQMYGGVSGEILWKPVSSRLALGTEINYVKQREFDQMFGFRDYDVVTGYASAYYDFGNGFSGTLDVGRYLAGDIGATVSLDREFDNGWKVGAYATRTDVTFEDFGEGSFDKGIRLTIPLDWFTGTPTRRTTDLTLRSLNRDGGARLSVDGRLYDRVRDTHAPALESRWGRFWR